MAVRGADIRLFPQARKNPAIRKNCCNRKSFLVVRVSASSKPISKDELPGFA
jgi:hypothetical protein